MMSSVFWEKTLNSLITVNQRFRGTRRLHLQGRRTSQARNQHETGSKQSFLHTSFLFDLFFEPEAGGDMFLQNPG
jgi:hypothetical protein